MTYKIKLVYLDEHVANIEINSNEKIVKIDNNLNEFQEISHNFKNWESFMKFLLPRLNKKERNSLNWKDIIEYFKRTECFYRNDGILLIPILDN